MSTLFNLVLSLYFLLTPLYSVSAPPFPFEVEQSDGSKISVRLFGSEYYNLMETEDGYVIKYINNDLYQGWFYSLLDENGEFIPSDILVKYPAPNDLEIPKHLRETSPRIRNLNYHPENINAFQHNNLQRGILDSTLKPLVLLVNFRDEGPTYSPENFANLLFAENLESVDDPDIPGDYKMSVRDYYDEISNGKQKIIGDVGSVVGWERASNDYSHYVDGSNGTGQGTNGVSQSAAALIVEIAMKIDEEGFDFTQFDNGGGVIDVVILIVAGKGGNQTGNFFWPHMYVVPTLGNGLEDIDIDLEPAPSNSAGYFSPGSTNGVGIYKYIVIHEKYFLSQNGASIHPIGTICHEIGHVLGLPDLYNTLDLDDPGIGRWGLMGSGNYYQQPSPAYMSAWSRYRLGYIEPFIVGNIIESIQEVLLPAEIGSSEQTAMILPMDTNMPQEYLIIENRQKMGSDQDLNSTSSGLMVWQVDETMTDIYPARNVNDNPDCYGISHLGSAMTILNNPYTYSYDRDGDGDIDQGSGSNIAISNIVEDLNEVISLEVINPNLQGNVIGYDEGNYEGTAFSSGGAIEWAGIHFQSPADVLLSGVMTVFPPSTSVSNLSYTIKIWHGWSESSNKPLELRYTYDGNVDWESESLRDGGWAFISFIDEDILLQRGDDYYIEINHHGNGFLYPFDNGSWSLSSAPSYNSYFRSSPTAACISLNNIESQQGELIAPNGDWNLRAVLSGSDEILSNEFDFVPQKHEIYSNYPNPFNPVTTLSIYLTNPSAVSYIVFDLRGRQILQKEFNLLGSGRHRFEVNMKEFSSGVYFYQFTINDEKYSPYKMLLLK